MVLLRCLCFSCGQDAGPTSSSVPSPNIVTPTPIATPPTRLPPSSNKERRPPLPPREPVQESPTSRLPPSSNQDERPSVPVRTSTRTRVLLPEPLSRGPDTIITIPPVIEVPSVAPIKIPQYLEKPTTFFQVDLPLPPMEAPLRRDMLPSAPPEEFDFSSDVNFENAMRRPKLKEIQSTNEIQQFDVKQLKMLLSDNFVDFTGFIEKSELVERAMYLYYESRNRISSEDEGDEEESNYYSPDDTPTEQLCKICMDAPLECVLLECGHIASCLECGNKLSECPICRQYVARVVKTFKA